MKLRPYQHDAVTACYDYLRTKTGNPCIVLPTGTGKSLVIAQIAADTVQRWHSRVIVLAHVQELLEQNADKIRRLCPSLDVGIYSAGLKSRDVANDVIVAGIQSVYMRAPEIGKVALIIVDEAHRIPTGDEGMYRKFLADALLVNPRVRVIGLTATPYRLSVGEICGEDNILNGVCYEANIADMIRDGYLSPLTCRAGTAEPNLDAVHTRRGEFVQSEAEAVMDEDALVSAACQEVVEKTRDRRAVLVFCQGVKHARHVAACLSALTGEDVAIVTGDTPASERAELIARFRGETTDLFQAQSPLRFLANVGVLTTGFDAPRLDCVVLLCCTQSVGLYVQMVGRGTRLCKGKANCLVLDYGLNVVRHGPVDDLRIPKKGNGGGDGEAPAKMCPECRCLIHASYRVCPECEHEFPPPKIHHDTSATNWGIMSDDVVECELDVTRTTYAEHVKKGVDLTDTTIPRTLRVTYHTAQGPISEWLCPEHKQKWLNFEYMKWWRARSVLPPPRDALTAAEAGQAGDLAETLRIRVVSKRDGLPKITALKTAPKPLPTEAGIRAMGSSWRPGQRATRDDDLQF